MRPDNCARSNWAAAGAANKSAHATNRQPRCNHELRLIITTLPSRNDMDPIDETDCRSGGYATSRVSPVKGTALLQFDQRWGSGSQGMTWQDTFDAFAARKRKAAETARLPGYTTVAADDTGGAGLEPIASPWTAALFDGPFFETPSPDPALPGSQYGVRAGRGREHRHAKPGESRRRGQRHAPDLRGAVARARGCRPDRREPPFTAARWSSASGTPSWCACAEDLGLPRHPAQIVATRSGRLGIASELLFNVPEVPVFILTTAPGAAALNPRVEARPWITVLVSGARRASPRRAEDAARGPWHPPHLVHRRPHPGDGIDRRRTRAGHLPHDVTRSRRRTRDAVLHGCRAAPDDLRREEVPAAVRETGVVFEHLKM